MPATITPPESGRSSPHRVAPDDRLRAFERDWSPGSLAAVAADPAVTGSSEADRRSLLAELVKVDLRLGWADGAGRRVEDYLAAHPDLAAAADADPALLAELIRAECSARAAAGQRTSMKRLRARFPDHADQVRSLLGGAARKKRGRSAPDVDTGTVGGRTVTGGRTTSKITLPETFGRYRILKLLGEGAMGAVHLAEDSQLHRRVALKTPTLDTAGDPEVVDRFYREARTAATLRHPNVCPVYDVGEEADGSGNRRLFLTMAYIEGKSLDDAVDGPQPVRAAVKLVRKIADAMAHAHDHGIVHRDLKPANVMLDERGEPLVMDFGLARRFAGGRDGDDDLKMTRVGSLLGSPAYMSPEQVRAEPDEIGPQSDVFSLGVMLYELLTGELPFRGASLTAVLGKILTQDPTPPSALRSEVDADLESVWRKMTARDRSARYDSMHAVRDALTDHLRPGTSVAPKPITADGSLPDGPEPTELVTEPVPVLPPTSPPQRRRARRKARPAPSKWAKPAGIAAAVLVLLGVVTITYLGPDGTSQTVTVDVPGEVTDVSVGGGDGAVADGSAGSGDVRDPWLTVGDEVDATGAGDHWLELFNGRNLDGWHAGGPNQSWSVRDGLLTGSLSEERVVRAADLTTFLDFDDYEVRAVLRAGNDTNSGVVPHYRPSSSGRTAEADYLESADRGEIGSIWSSSQNGDTVSLKVPEEISARAVEARGGNGEPPGWDVLAARVVGGRFAVAINGVVTATAAFDDMPPGGKLRLLVKRDSNTPALVEFRSVRVRRLGPDGRPLAPPARPADAWIDLLADPATSRPSLAAWESWNGGATSANWELHPDGTLRRRRGGTTALQDLSTRESYGDFELAFDWKVAPGGNSGVVYRAATGPPNASSTGPEYQLLDDDGHPNGSTAETRAGSLYGLYAPADADASAHQWNTSRIVAVGNRLAHWLNGTKVVVADLASAEWEDRRAAFLKGKRGWDGFAGSAAGRIVLQDHGDEVWFRNVRVRRLPLTDEPAAGAGEWVAVFADGKLGPNVSPGGYTIEDGLLTWSGSGSDLLFVDRPLRDFRARLRFRMTEGMNEQGEEPGGMLLFRSPNGRAGRTLCYTLGLCASERGPNNVNRLYDFVYRSWRARQLTTLEHTTSERTVRSGEWNDLELVVRGGRIRTTLNGLPGHDFVDETYPAGVLGLLLHRPKIEVESFIYQPLRSETPAAGGAATPAVGSRPAAPPGEWVTVFGDGRLGSDVRMHGGFGVVNGLLEKTGDGDGLLFHKPSLRNFHARLKYRLPPDAEAALVFRCPNAFRDREQAYSVGLGSERGWIYDIETPHRFIYKSGRSRPIGDRTGSADSVEVTPDGWHLLDVSVRGETCDVSLDGTRLYSFTDDTHTAGALGLHARHGGLQVERFEYRPLPDDAGVPADDGGTDWVDLFNGTDLGGWAAGVNRDAWTVDAGQLVADADKFSLIMHSKGPRVDADGRSAVEYTVEYRTSPGAQFDLRIARAGENLHATLGDPRLKGWGEIVHYLSGRDPGERILSEGPRTPPAGASPGSNGWVRATLRVTGESAELRVGGEVVGRTDTLPRTPDDARFSVALRPGGGPGSLRIRSLRVRPLSPDGTPVAAARPDGWPHAWPAPAPPVRTVTFERGRDSDDGKEVYADGVFRVTHRGGNYATNASRIDGPGVVMLRGRVVGPHADAKWGFNVTSGSKDAGDRRGFRVLADGRGNAWIKRSLFSDRHDEPDVLRKIADPTPFSADADGPFHTLAAAVEGRVVTLVLDGAVLGSATFPDPMLPGTVSVTREGAAGAVMEFDHLEIHDLPAGMPPAVTGIPG